MTSRHSVILPPHGGSRDVQIAISILPNGGLRLQFDSRIDFVDLSPAQIRQLGASIVKLANARNLHQ